MSLKSQNINCVYCHSYFFEEDDVVYCPECGAPHHRECYNTLGHCALETLHGTENEYSRVSVEKKEAEADNADITDKKVFKCEICGEEYDFNSMKCPKCDTPNLKRINNFAEFDFLGGVPADYDLGDGVTAEDAKKFVLSNTHRYIPKFASLNKKKKTSWNWIAFLSPAGWMLSRKMYKGGILIAILNILAACLSYPLSLKLYRLNLLQNGYLTNDLSLIVESLPEIGAAVIGLALIGSLFDLGIRLFSAILGDYFYKNFAIQTIKNIKLNSDDVLTDYRKKGGMSLVLFFLGIMLVQYGSVFIQLFL